MAFRETDERPSGLARLPREAKTWLHELFLEDWTLKLLALAITLGLWYGVTGQRTPQTIRLPRIPLDFQLPGDMEISNDPRREVDIVVTGSAHLLDQIKMRDLIARVDVRDYKSGERFVQLSPRIKLDLPSGVRIEKIEPNTVQLWLEPRVEREVDVEVRREGAPAEGYEVRGITIAPNKIKVRGPASHVSALQKAVTEMISLEGRRESFTIAQAAIDISDSKIDIVNEPVVNVSVEIGEQRFEKSFAGVSVIVRDQLGAQARPQSASVTLYGPKSLLDQLRADQLKIILVEGEDGAITPQLELPPEFQNRGIELRSTKPAGFSITK